MNVGKERGAGRKGGNDFLAGCLKKEDEEMKKAAKTKLHSPSRSMSWNVLPHHLPLLLSSTAIIC